MFDYRQKIDHFIRMLVPGICTLMLLILSLLPIQIKGLALFPLDVCLISIYYWTIFRPKVLPFWFAFALGVIRDALMGMPLGISSLVFLLFRLLVLTQQRLLVKESFWTTWLGFGVMAAPAFAMQWMLASAYVKAFQPFIPLVMQWVFTFGLYPLLHIVFNAIYRFLPEQAGRKKPHSKPLL